MSHPALPQSCFETRRQELLGRVFGDEDGVLMVFGQGSALGAGTKSHGALRYLVDWDSHEASSLLILSRAHAKLLIGSPFLVPIARETLCNVDCIDQRPQDWHKTLASIPQTATMRIASIGFAEMPVGLYQTLTQSLDHPIVDAGPDLDLLRLHKDDHALSLHRAGAGICDALFAALKDELTREQPIWKTQLTLESKARALGADYCRTWLTIRERADYPRFWPEEGQNIPSEGDQVLFGIALTVRGHWAHGIRMGTLGQTQPAHRTLWAQVRDMLDAGLEALRPGNPVAAAEAAMNAALQAHYNVSQIDGMARFRNGHGLGMSYEDPLITDCFPQFFGTPGTIPDPGNPIVEPGMLFELHPNFFGPEIGGAALGQMVFVGEEQNECLIRHPIDFTVY